MATDLEALAKKLIHDGPHKVEDTPKHVRALFGGMWVVDTANAKLVWEHPYYPQVYVPTTGINAACVTTSVVKDIDSGSARIVKLTTSPRLPSTKKKSTERVISFLTGDLTNYVRIEFRELDQWFLEAEPIYVHPKDPYKRIEIHPSGRHVRVEIDGVTVAESDLHWQLYETTLPCRYYLPKTSVTDWELLSESNLVTLCPYKGDANYYNVTVNGKQHENVVWWYKYPTAESIAVTGLLCFYNEKVDIFLEGRKLERPKTKFA